MDKEREEKARAEIYKAMLTMFGDGVKLGYELGKQGVRWDKVQRKLKHEEKESLARVKKEIRGQLYGTDTMVQE